MKSIITFLPLLLLIQCAYKAENNATPKNMAEPNEAIKLTYNLNTLIKNTKYAIDSNLGGYIKSRMLKEASGLCLSKSNPQCLWSHNDKGNPNRLYLLGTKGQNYGYYTLTGAGSRDYEDICIGPGPMPGINYIYLGDIGDNDAVYPSIVIYRIQEPILHKLDSNSTHIIPAEHIERLEFEYPDGPVDSETLMIDPINKDLYIVSKREFRSHVYRAPYPQKPNTKTKLQKLAQLPFNFAVAGDISSDGKKIVIKDLYRIFCWNRAENESVLDALKRAPERLTYIPEPQGESFAFTNNAASYFTLSEQSGTTPSYLYHYKK